MPEFKNEKDGAAWFDDQRHLEETFGEPLPTQATPLHERLGLTRRRAASQPITIRLGQEDLHLARQLAERFDLPYQTLLKKLIHDGLQQLSKGA